MNAPPSSVVVGVLVAASEPVVEPLLLVELLLVEPPPLEEPLLVEEPVPVEPSPLEPVARKEQLASTHTLVANVTNASFTPTIRA
jgi:hypothetical protein